MNALGSFERSRAGEIAAIRPHSALSALSMFLPRVFAGVLSMTSAWAASTQCSQASLYELSTEVWTLKESYIDDVCIAEADRVELRVCVSPIVLL
jgi:hypothetical protein